MSVLGAINLMFVDCLKEQVKGWQIFPLAQYVEDGVMTSSAGYTAAMSPRANRWITTGRYLRTHTVGSEQSPKDLIRQYPPKDKTFILLKAPKKPLRILTLRYNERKVMIRYHRANGYKQTLEPMRGRWGSSPGPYVLANITIFELRRMYRVTRRRKKSNVYHKDWFRPADADNMGRTAALVIMMFEKSFVAEKRLTKRQGNHPIGIDLELAEPLNVSEHIPLC